MTKREDGCKLCPRACGAKRLEGQKGRCGCDNTLRVARAALHMWEEPCISGGKGSGAVFFSGCPLHCIYCQNAEISGGNAGKAISTERLANIFLELQEQGAANINLVTAGHYAPQVCEALRMAKGQGLVLPIVFNSSGYETEETLASFAPYVDIWLPDMKYIRQETASAFSHAPDYPEVAKKAIAAMVRYAGEPLFDQDGYMQRGVIVRHLVLPGHAAESTEVVRYLYEAFGDTVYFSIMNQYTPPAHELPYRELNRVLTTYEYEKVIKHAISTGVERAFVQEKGTAKESFIPSFDAKGV